MIHRSGKAPGENGVHRPVKEVVTRKGGITFNTIKTYPPSLASALLSTTGRLALQSPSVNYEPEALGGLDIAVLKG